MIGWENDRGAYFIQKLQDKVIDLAEDVGDNSTDISVIKTNIGAMSDLTTTADTLVGAINEANRVLNAGSILNNQSVTLLTPNNARFILVSIGTSAPRCGLWLGYTGSTGGNYLLPVITAGTDLTVDTSVDGQITITNANQGASATIGVINITDYVTVGS